MTTVQRVHAIILLTLVAVILHTSLCDWRYRYTGRGRTPRDVPLLGYSHPEVWLGEPQVRGSVRLAPLTGLFPQTDSRELGLLAGVALPMVLLGGSLYVVLGWRYHWRKARWRCTKCGYDMSSDATASRCPECGWRRPPA